MVKTIETLDSEGYDLNVFWQQIMEKLHKAMVSIALGQKDDIFSEEDTELLIYTLDIFKKAYLEARNFTEKKDIYQLTVLKLKFMKNLIPIKELLEKGISVQATPHIKETKQTEPKEEKFDIQKAILKIGKEAGGIVSGALKNANIKEENDKFVILVEKTIADLLKSKLDIIQKYFPKTVEIQEIEIKPEKKKSKKRDESVDKVLDLFQGKLISYKEE